jgi:DNA replication and repair protein RecF
MAMVFILPEDINITSGSPKYHRNFLDIYLSQFSKQYLLNLIEYQKVLKQRNALLKRLKSGDSSASTKHLDAWDNNLVGPIIRIVGARAKFISEIASHVTEISSRISGGLDLVEVKYRPRLSFSDPADKMAAIEAIRAERNREIRMGASILGPHRDTMEVTINGTSLECFGSMGQRKTVMIAMKLAALKTLSEHRGEQAILVLDEAFAALDKNRSSLLLDLLSGIGQVFLASASKDDISYQGIAKTFEICNGIVKEC